MTICGEAAEQRGPPGGVIIPPRLWLLPLRFPSFPSFHLLVACLSCTFHSFRRLFRKSHHSRLASGVTSLGETTTSLDSVFLSSFSNSQVYVCDATKAVVPSSCAITLGLKVFGRIVAAAGLAGAALQALDGSSPRTGRRTCTVFEALIALAGDTGCHEC